jgi:DNA-binding CsgD family transcriptional regulator
MRDRLPEQGSKAPASDLSLLSAREREVLETAMEGLSARAIATRLSLTEATVRSHLSAIYSKLGVSGRVELMALVNDRVAVLPNASPEIAKDPPSHVRRRLRPGAVGLAAIGVVALTLAAILLAQLATSPPRTDLAAVSRLIAEKQVAQLDLRDTTLTVTKTDGERLVVESVTSEAFQPIETAAIDSSVAVTISGGTSAPLATQLAIAAGWLLYTALVAVLALFRLARGLARPIG